MTKLERETILEALNLLKETNNIMTERHGSEYPSNNDTIDACIAALDGIKSNDEIKAEFSNTDYKKIKFSVTRKMIIQVLFSESHYSAYYLQTRGYSELCNLLWYHVGQAERAQVIE